MEGRSRFEFQWIRFRSVCCCLRAWSPCMPSRAFGVRVGFYPARHRRCTPTPRLVRLIVDRRPAAAPRQGARTKGLVLTPTSPRRAALVAEPEARTRTGPAGPVAGVREFAPAERQAAAPDAPGQPRPQPLE